MSRQTMWKLDDRQSQQKSRPMKPVFRCVGQTNDMVAASRQSSIMISTHLATRISERLSGGTIGTDLWSLTFFSLRLQKFNALFFFLVLV